MPATTKATKRHTKKPPKKKSAARKRAAPSLVGALADAAWTEADQALAEALVESDEVEAAASAAQRNAAIALLVQALSRAARKRGLSRIGEIGAREPFDPVRHEFVAAVAKKPKTVRIAARGVARGTEILMRPRVGPVARKAGRRKSGK